MLIEALPLNLPTDDERYVILSQHGLYPNQATRECENEDKIMRDQREEGKREGEKRPAP